MKKIIYTCLVFSCGMLSAQKTYKQYKQEREYSKRYNNEQKQLFNVRCNKALKEWDKLVADYEALIYKNKSKKYVDETYPKAVESLNDLWTSLLASTNLMNNQQLEHFNKVKNRLNQLWDSPYYYQ
ncbi:hypothetical protein [Epilithonimonas tenax]|uniref:hypothetical protein n=1 Tax=Epilithonimonas tenax TaxID=191577 RepID=UPI0012B5B9D1|nr:hypothetical protein [Epilithonimonas tenax]